MRVSVVVTVCLALLLPAAAARAQTPDTASDKASDRLWTLTASAGLSLTSGNTNTSTINTSYDVSYRPSARNTFKSDALLIRGKTDGELSTNRLSLNVRHEYRVDGAYIVAKNQYLRDQFKEIGYLVSPTIGLGIRPVDSDDTTLSMDAGVGGVWEKDTGGPVNASGAVTVSQKLSQAVSATTTLTQSFSGLWKTQDLHDSLYTLGVSLAATISARTQLKVEGLTTFKNKPPRPDLKRNDVSALFAIVFKN